MICWWWYSEDPQGCREVVFFPYKTGSEFVIISDICVMLHSFKRALTTISFNPQLTIRAFQYLSVTADRGSEFCLRQSISDGCNSWSLGRQWTKGRTANCHPLIQSSHRLLNQTVVPLSRTYRRRVTKVHLFTPVGIQGKKPLTSASPNTERRWCRGWFCLIWANGLKLLKERMVYDISEKYHSWWFHYQWTFKMSPADSRKRDLCLWPEAKSQWPNGDGSSLSFLTTDPYAWAEMFKCLLRDDLLHHGGFPKLNV